MFYFRKTMMKRKKNVYQAKEFGNNAESIDLPHARKGFIKFIVLFYIHAGVNNGRIIMADLDLMQKSIDFIEENLKAELTLTDIADKAGFSPFHFCRTFQKAVGMPVMAYVLRRRLLHAAYHIYKGMDAVQAALSYGFDTYAGFYKAFVREFDKTPASCKKQGSMPPPHRIDLQKGVDIMLSNAKLQVLLQKWAIKDRNISPIQYENSGIIADNAWYVGQEYVLKATQNLPGFKTHTAIVRAITEDGMNAPVPILTQDRQDFIQGDDLYFYLLPRLKGKPVNSRALMEKDWAQKAFRLGGLIGRLHKVLSRFDRELKLDEPDLFAAVRDWAMPRTQAVLSLPPEFYQTYTEHFQHLYPLLPKQPIHRDPNPANIMMEGEELSGFIDFELGQRSIRLFDPCYLTTAILSETIPESGCPLDDKWFEVYRSVLQGYDTVCPLARVEREAAPYTVFTIQMICLAYFTDNPKFEKLADINKRMFLWLWEKREKLQII
jgi:Ser/Thr protein kinase RdoA (MazF antagonist)/AraC-like DNA-binding protein